MLFFFLVRHFELLRCAFDTDGVAANRQVVSDVDVREAFYRWFYCRTCQFMVVRIVTVLTSVLLIQCILQED